MADYEWENIFKYNLISFNFKNIYDKVGKIHSYYMTIILISTYSQNQNLFNYCFHQASIIFVFHLLQLAFKHILCKCFHKRNRHRYQKKYSCSDFFSFSVFLFPLQWICHMTAISGLTVFPTQLSFTLSHWHSW